MAENQWAYLNAGAWIAKTVFYRKFIKECLTMDLEPLVKARKLPPRVSPHELIVENDQIIFYRFFKKYYPQMKIDYENKIFLNLSRVPAFRNYIKIYRHFYEIPLSEYLAMLLDSYKRLSRLSRL